LDIAAPQKPELVMEPTASTAKRRTNNQRADIIGLADRPKNPVAMP